MGVNTTPSLAPPPHGLLRQRPRGDASHSLPSDPTLPRPRGEVRRLRASGTKTNGPSKTRKKKDWTGGKLSPPPKFDRPNTVVARAADARPQCVPVRPRPHPHPTLAPPLVPAHVPPPAPPVPDRAAGRPGQITQVRCGAGRRSRTAGPPIPPAAGVAWLPAVFLGVKEGLEPRRRRGGAVPGWRDGGGASGAVRRHARGISRGEAGPGLVRGVRRARVPPPATRGVPRRSSCRTPGDGAIRGAPHVTWGRWSGGIAGSADAIGGVGALVRRGAARSGPSAASNGCPRRSAP